MGSPPLGIGMTVCLETYVTIAFFARSGFNRFGVRRGDSKFSETRAPPAMDGDVADPCQVRSNR